MNRILKYTLTAVALLVFTVQGLNLVARNMNRLLPSLPGQVVGVTGIGNERYFYLAGHEILIPYQQYLLRNKKDKRLKYIRAASPKVLEDKNIYA